ncbi:MAG: SDR family oxidoreductase [Bacteroidia bacterium]
MEREFRNAHPALAEAFILHADIGEEASCNAFLQALPADFKIPDVLVLNAGSYFTGRPSQMDAQELKRAIDANAGHAIRICKALVPAMAKRNRGTIVFTGSIVNHEPRMEACAYTLAKNVLDNYAKMLQEEFRDSASVSAESSRVR